MARKDKTLLLILVAGLAVSFALTLHQTIFQKSFAASDTAAIQSGICGGETPSFLGTFDFSTAPPLLFYAYGPIIIASALLAWYLARGKNSTLRTKLFVAVLAFFILWVVNVLIQWVASYHMMLMLAWQLTAVFEIGLYFSALYFAYVFIHKADLPFWAKTVLTTLGLVVIAMVPTRLNVSSYDVQNCEGVVGPLWDFIYYFLEPLIIVALIGIGISALRTEREALRRRQIALFTLSFVFFLTTFFLSNLYGEVTKVYQFNLWGPLGMVAFFMSIGYMIVKFHTFHTKLIATQALVWGLALLIGSQFFYIVSPINFVLNGVAFVAALVFGALLIRSVQVEIRQKEELATLLQQRESLEHLVTHKVKGAFTRTKFAFEEMLDGTVGKINQKAKDLAQLGLTFSEDGIASVDQVLNVANMKKGTIKYEMKPVEFKAIVLDAIAQKTGPAEKKGLTIIPDIGEGTFMTLGDAFWLKEVAYNLIDNAVKYTPKGTITVGLHLRSGKLLFSVKDTGGGITDEDKKVLFTEGGRGKESTKVNVDSTGYGLFTIKVVVDAHQGRVWVESAVGKGATFFVELSLIK